MAIVSPSMALPAYRRYSLSLKFFQFDGYVKVYGPESSLIPKVLIRKKLRLIKYARVDSRIGAAPKTSTSHSSNPKFFFMLLKMTFLAILHPKGSDPPFIYA